MHIIFAILSSIETNYTDGILHNMLSVKAVRVYSEQDIALKEHRTQL